MADLDKYQGKRVRITINHGETERILVGKLRAFESGARYDPLTGELVAPAEPRWELTKVREDRGNHRDAGGRAAYDDTLVERTYEAVGIDPATVADISPLN